MSVQTQLKRITVPEIRGHKGEKPVVCLTCYHAHTAKLLDNYVDLMLVGDSLGMVMHGLESTLSVTLDMMILHGKAVMRGSNRALVAVDMPAPSLPVSPNYIPACSAHSLEPFIRRYRSLLGFHMLLKFIRISMIVSPDLRGHGRSPKILGHEKAR